MRNNKSQEILQYFTKNKTEQITINKLSDVFLVSPRQIKNYINKINEDKEIIVKKDRGYTLSDNYKEEETHHADLLPKQRVNIIISKLLTNKEIDIFDLADELFISRPTIENDLKKVRKITESFDITLSCNNDRYSLNGLERDKRKLTSYMIRNTDYKGFSYCNSSFFLNKEYSTDNLKTRIQDIFKQCHFVYNDYSINNVLLHLTITIERLKNKYTLEKNTCTSIDSESLRASKMIFEYLKEEYSVEYDEAEINNLAIFLSCNIATIDCKKANKDIINEIIDKKIISTAEDIANEICDFYLLDEFDDIFMSRFILHIDNLIKRQENNFSARNPLQENLMETYPLLYDIAVFAANIFKRETGYSINNDEISLLALHIGSFIESSNSNKDKVIALYIYANYHDFYQSNIQKLTNRFQSTLNIKYSSSILDYINKTDSFSDVDLIISEVNHPNVLKISPFITEEDFNSVYHEICSTIEKKNSLMFAKSLSNLFKKEMFFCNINQGNEFALIHQLVTSLKDMNLFNEGFENSVIDREKASPTCFTNHVAIPHAITQHVKRSFISITTFDKPQTWANKQVSLVILIGIAYPDRKMFRSVFNNLVKQIKDDSLVARLSRCNTYEELLSIITKS